MTGMVVMIVVPAAEVGGEAAVLALVRLWRPVTAVRYWVNAVWVNALLALADLVVSTQWYAAGEAIASLIAMALWWWSRRRRRDRVAKWLGGKSRAARDALVRRARQAWQPRPDLAPGGAR